LKALVEFYGKVEVVVPEEGQTRQLSVQEYNMQDGVIGYWFYKDLKHSICKAVEVDVNWEHIISNSSGLIRIPLHKSRESIATLLLPKWIASYSTEIMFMDPTQWAALLDVSVQSSLKDFILSCSEVTIAEMVSRCLATFPVDLRRKLTKSFVLCGGSSTIPGFATRFLKEVQKLLNSSVDVGLIFIPAIYDGGASHFNASCWVGGSFLANTCNVSTSNSLKEVTKFSGGASLSRQFVISKT
jgi:hypothetical protein